MKHLEECLALFFPRSASYEDIVHPCTSNLVPLPLPRFAYPAAAAVSTFWLLLWQTFRVGRARKAAQVDYPQGKWNAHVVVWYTDGRWAVYAEKAEAAANQAALKFNCVQRK